MLKNPNVFLIQTRLPYHNFHIAITIQVIHCQRAEFISGRVLGSAGHRTPLMIENRNVCPTAGNNNLRVAITTQISNHDT